MTTTTGTAHDPTGDVVRMVALHAAAVALPVLVVALFLVPAWAAVLVALVAGVAVTALRARGIDARIARALGARAIEPGDVPRLANAAEQVSMSVGVAAPRLHVIDDAARNAVAWGSGPSGPSIALTSGLLEVAEPIELEGVVAHLLADVRDGLVESPTVATALFGGLAGGPLAGIVARFAQAGAEERRIVLADLEGARATRYPPGVVVALERVRAGTSQVARNPRAMQALWFAAPGESAPDDPFDAHPPLADRIDLLREL